MQRPHPPIWVGGNSLRAIRRAVELGDGWVPFPNTAAMAKYTRTPAMETLDDLAGRVAFAREHAAAIGRQALLPLASRDAAATRARIEELGALGVTWLTVGFPADTRADYIAALRRFAREALR